MKDWKQAYQNEKKRADELYDKLQRPHRVAICVTGGVADFEECGEANTDIRIFDFDDESSDRDAISDEYHDFINGK